MPAVLCRKCGKDLPDGSQFCFKCGEPVGSTVTVSEIPTAVLGCAGCGAQLAEGAQFCSRCGKSVSVPPRNAKPADFTQPIDPTPQGPDRRSPASSRRKRRVISWVLAILFLVALFWAATSDNFLAQGLQESAGWKHDQGLVDRPFSVSPHNLRYYKFALPQGSVHVSIVGEFTASSDSGSARGQGSAQPSGSQSDNNIEVYVMSEPAFIAWQNGYATSNVYESGRVSHGSFQADMPSGAGIYYLIFNNKFAPNTAKQVTADVLLHYKNWLPESFRRMSERFWNWIGL